MKLPKTWLKPIFMTLALFFASFSLQAETPEEKGLAIAKAGKISDLGWLDMKAKMKMILRNAHGEESLREIRIKSLEILNDGDKSLIIFDKPRDVKGAAFLSFGHALKADDQWLYLPALKRVKRISSRNKSGPFMGSEFAYEDFSSFEIEKYTYKFLREEVCEQYICNVIEQYPVDKYSGYTRLISWVDKSERRVWKTEYYDRKKALLKTLTYHDYQQYLDKHWRPGQMKMINHQTDKQTVLVYSDYQFKTGMDDNYFNSNALKRVH